MVDHLPLDPAPAAPLPRRATLNLLVGRVTTIKLAYWAALTICEIALPLFVQRHDIIIPQNLNNDQKFDYIFSLVQLMKIDERMYREEILFCSTIASTLGYEKEVMFELMLYVKSVRMKEDEVSTLKEVIQKFLIKE